LSFLADYVTGLVPMNLKNSLYENVIPVVSLIYATNRVCEI